jgi:ferric-dicitrate binding protein FerR (iron transport regulator)
MAKREITLYGGDHIRTGEDTTGYIGFQDMSTFILKAESEIVLLVPENKDSKLKLVAGNIWTNFKKMVKDGSMEIDMDQAVLGTKGTTFVCSSDGKTSTMQIIEGTVEITGKADKKKILVSGGQQVTATSNGLGTPVAFDAPAAQADWDAVKAKALSGTPAPVPATTKKSGLESLLVLAAFCIVVAGIVFRRE